VLNLIIPKGSGRLLKQYTHYAKILFVRETDHLSQQVTRFGQPAKHTIEKFKGAIQRTVSWQETDKAGQTICKGSQLVISPTGGLLECRHFAQSDTQTQLKKTLPGLKEDLKFRQVNADLFLGRRDVTVQGFAGSLKDVQVGRGREVTFKRSHRDGTAYVRKYLMDANGTQTAIRQRNGQESVRVTPHYNQTVVTPVPWKINL
jgi:hypothetical protein